MRRILIALTLLVPAVVASQVYRWIDADGKTHYSDRPVAGAEALGIPVKTPLPLQEKAAPAQSSPGPYIQFEIVAPADNSTVRDPEGNVTLGLVLEPQLMEGHRLQILTDGAPASGDIPGTQLRLSGLPLGSHQIQARIIDAGGTAIASSSVVRFHLLKPDSP